LWGLDLVFRMLGVVAHKAKVELAGRFVELEVPGQLFVGLSHHPDGVSHSASSHGLFAV
jgi:hypothetical protein